MRGKLLIASLALLGAVVAGPSYATTYTFNFAAPALADYTNDLTVSSKEYTSVTGGLKLTASGYQNAVNPGSGKSVGDTWNPLTVKDNNLTEKFRIADAGETGLGLTGTTDREIGTQTLVNLDISKFNKPSQNYGNLKLLIGSIQHGEGFYVWGSHASGGNQTYTLLDHYTNTGSDSNDETSFSVLNTDFANYDFITVSASSADVLIDNGVTVDAVPEASTLIGFGSLLSLGGLALRNRKKIA